MSVWIAKCLGFATVAGPSLVLCGGAFDWGDGTREELFGVDARLGKQKDSVAGQDWSNSFKNIEKEINSGGGSTKHPGLFVETVEGYMKRILNKERGTEKKGPEFEVKGEKRVFEEVRFKKDSSTGGLSLALKLAKEQKYLGSEKGLCVISVTDKERDSLRWGADLFFIIGFAHNSWTGGKAIEFSGTEGLIQGYEDWCERRAQRFDSEKNLIIGIPFNNTFEAVSSGTQTGGHKKFEKVKKVTYFVKDKAVAFVGKELNSGSSGYDRICATLKGESDCKKNIFPVVLGAIGQKTFNTFKYGSKASGEGNSVMYWGSSSWDHTNEVKYDSKNTIRIPVGVKFTNVKIKGTSLSNLVNKLNVNYQ